MGACMARRKCRADEGRQSGRLSIAGPRVSFEGSLNRTTSTSSVPRQSTRSGRRTWGRIIVEMVNLVFGVILQDRDTAPRPGRHRRAVGRLPIDECTDLRATDRHLRPVRGPVDLTQSRPGDRLSERAAEPLLQHCVAISTTCDPGDGLVLPVRFSTGYKLPRLPQYGVWRDHYLITTREFGILDPSVYAIGVTGSSETGCRRRPECAGGQLLIKEGEVPLNLIGDGLLPADMDGKSKRPRRTGRPRRSSARRTMTRRTAPFDALKIWEFAGTWVRRRPRRSSETQLPVAEFDSDFPLRRRRWFTARRVPATAFRSRGSGREPCISTSSPTGSGRPGAAPTATSVGRGPRDEPSVEALPGIAGVRWSRSGGRTGRPRSTSRRTTLPTTACTAGWAASRWTSTETSPSLQRLNGTDVYPGSVTTGRKAGDSLGQMTLGEGVSHERPGVQTSVNSRGRLHLAQRQSDWRLRVSGTERVLHRGGQASSPGRLADTHASFRSRLRVAELEAGRAGLKGPRRLSLAKQA